MFIKKDSLKKENRKKKIIKLFGSIKNYCIFAPLFKKIFSDGRREGKAIPCRDPLRSIQCKFYNKRQFIKYVRYY